MGWTGLGLLAAGIVLLLFVTPVVIVRHTQAPAQVTQAPVTTTTTRPTGAPNQTPITTKDGSPTTVPPTTPTTVPTVPLPPSITICVSNLFQVFVGADKC